MARNFKELEAKIRPESLARAKLRAREIIAHLPGRDVRIHQFRESA